MGGGREGSGQRRGDEFHETHVGPQTAASSVPHLREHLRGESIHAKAAGRALGLRVVALGPKDRPQAGAAFRPKWKAFTPHLLARDGADGAGDAWAHTAWPQTFPGAGVSARREPASGTRFPFGSLLCVLRRKAVRTAGTQLCAPGTRLRETAQCLLGAF